MLYKTFLDGEGPGRIPNMKPIGIMLGQRKFEVKNFPAMELT